MYWDIHMIFILISYNLLHFLIINVQIPLHLWNKGRLIVIDIVEIWLNLAYIYFAKSFCIYVSQENWLVYSFHFCCALICFWCCNNANFKEVWKYSFCLQFAFNNLRSIDCSSSMKVWFKKMLLQIYLDQGAF